MSIHDSIEAQRHVSPSSERIARDLVADVAWLLSPDLLRTLAPTFRDADDFLWYATPPTFEVRIAAVGEVNLAIREQQWTLRRFVHLSDIHLFPYIDHWECAIPHQPGTWIASDGSLVGEAKPPQLLLSHSVRDFLREALAMPERRSA